MTKLVDAFRSFENAPKTFGIIRSIGLGQWVRRNYCEPCKPLLPVGVEVFSS
jgi:hypothetical protein